jgi:hypothetical protein
MNARHRPRHPAASSRAGAVTGHGGETAAGGKFVGVIGVLRVIGAGLLASLLAGFVHGMAARGLMRLWALEAGAETSFSLFSLLFFPLFYAAPMALAGITAAATSRHDIRLTMAGLGAGVLLLFEYGIGSVETEGWSNINTTRALILTAFALLPVSHALVTMHVAQRLFR